MQILVLLSAIGALSITIVLLVIAELSRRLGAVLRNRASYRWFYIAACLSAFSTLIRLLSVGLNEKDFVLSQNESIFALLYIAPSDNECSDGANNYMALLGVVGVC